MRLLLLGLLLAASCHRAVSPDPTVGAGDSDAAGRPRACDTVIPTSTERLIADTLTRVPGEMRAAAANKARGVATRLVPTLIKRCAQDGWMTDVLACFDRAASRASWDNCYQQLTADQRRGFDEDVHRANDTWFDDLSTLQERPSRSS